MSAKISDHLAEAWGCSSSAGGVGVGMEMPLRGGLGMALSVGLPARGHGGSRLGVSAIALSGGRAFAPGNAQSGRSAQSFSPWQEGEHEPPNHRSPTHQALSWRPHEGRTALLGCWECPSTADDSRGAVATADRGGRYGC